MRHYRSKVANRNFFFRKLKAHEVPSAVSDTYNDEAPDGIVYAVLRWEDDDLSESCFYVTARQYAVRREVHVFYANGFMHPSFGKNFEDAVDLAVADAFIFLSPTYGS